MQEKLKIAIEAALEAGKEISKIYKSNDFNVELKGDNSPLTKADLESHRVIKSFLEKTNIPILSEEGREISYETRKNWSELWIVDPIDGTKEFIKRNGEFTVNIALIQNGNPVLGVIYAPVLETLYFGALGLGSFKNHVNLENFDIDVIIGSSSIPIPISNDDDSFTVVASRSHISKETEDFIANLKKNYGKVNLVSIGSSLKLCLVAEGVAKCYPRFAPTMEWDTAAGHAIAIFAGMDLIDCKTGKEMVYNRENLLNNWFVVKNRNLKFD